MNWQEIKNIYHLIRSWAAVFYFGYPAKKLTVVGVTGTDGKTTTTNLIYEMLVAAKIKAGLVSTVNAKYYDGEKEVEIETGLHTTNPDAWQLQKLLVDMVKKGVTHVVLEVTSHGLDQNRVVGSNFKIGVLTNVTHEHLDYHKTMEKYKRAKAKLFDGVEYAVLNKDEPSLEFFKKRLKGGVKLVEYGQAKLKNVSQALAGNYNLANIGASLAVGRILGLDEKQMQSVVANFAGVAGRREEVAVGQKFRAFVDFAHTPNALKSILTQLKSELGDGKKLIVAFGCTGERDREKRPIMGRIAVDLADVVIITSDDTRSESQDDIYEQILAGIPQSMRSKVIKLNDRGEAVARAVSMAKPGDIVLMAGKGHEKSILIGKIDRPWSDREELEKAIKKGPK